MAQFQTMEFWLRRKYNLLPTDPRWLEMSPEDVEAEYLAHQYAEHGVPNEIEDEDFDEHMAELEAQLEGDPDPGAGGEDDFEEVINDKRH